MSRIRLASLVLLLGMASARPGIAQFPPPANLTVTTSACTDMVLSWSHSPGETGYVVYRDGGLTSLVVLPADATSYTDTAPPGNRHRYCLLAFYGGELSEPACASASFSTSAVTVEARDWYQDTFTSNETITSTLFSAYDTTSAWIRTGLNLAPLTGDATRQSLPADTVVVEAPGSSQRLDLVFRIVPGVGNYVTIGNRNAALRQVPTSTTAAVANAASTNFWESYLADNGAVGTDGNGTNGPGHFAGKWDPHLWNSARCDTAETNLFPTFSRHPNLPGIVPGRYASMYHEDDPKYVTLGVPRNRCFLVDPSGAINSTNINCGTGTFPPAWAAGAGLAPSEGGLGPGVTREFTPIIPDGQLTPGSHVQYYLRVSDESAPLTMLASNPDTSQVVPQQGCALDCSRWAEFSVLPDRWQNPSFGGLGMGCMLVVDLDDGRGDECAWVSIADSITGFTLASQRGAHNGWTMAPPGADLNDPAYHVRPHRGQPGSAWDLYSVRGSRDTLTGNAGSLGSRLSPRCTGCPASGRESRQGPTLTMVRAFYRIVVLLTGSRRVAILGPVADRGQNDVEVLQSFLTLPGGTPQPRGLWVMGSGFAESEANEHSILVNNMMRASLRHGDYVGLTGNAAASVMLTVTYPPSNTFGVRSKSLDVLLPQTPSPSGLQYAEYPPGFAQPPVVASVIKPESGVTSPYRTLLNGFDLADVGSIGNINTEGRRYFVMHVKSGWAAPMACWVPPQTGVQPLSLLEPSFRLGNNPLIEGAATVHLTLAARDHARIVIHDVAGRVLMVLADRNLEAGAHEFRWDGSDDAGRRVASGVYLVRATTASGRAEARSMVVLR